MAQSCYSYARERWNGAYPNNKLCYGPVTGPELWDQAGDYDYNASESFMSKSIVCWDDGGNGHVAWAIKDNGDGTMQVAESNWPVGTGPTTRNVNIGTRGAKNNYTLLGFVKP